MKKDVVVGTRGSHLALVQTESVVNKLKSAHPGLEISVHKIVTAGDRDRRTHLDRIGTDVFVKELEEALLDGRIDLAVHSLKDVPTALAQGLALIAVTKRDDPRDVLIARGRLANLPPNAKVGTGSLRRTIQLALLRPDIQTCPIRGNVDTRLRKVESGEIDGIVLAAAGLKRLGLQDKITEYLPLDRFLPAAGQGAIVIETRSDNQEIINLVQPLQNLPTWQSITAERSFLRELGGGCRAPIASLATIENGTLKLAGLVASPTRCQVLRDSIEGDAACAESLGINLARQVLALGASEYISEAKMHEIR